MVEHRMDVRIDGCQSQPRFYWLCLCGEFGAQLWPRRSDCKKPFEAHVRRAQAREALAATDVPKITRLGKGRWYVTEPDGREVATYKTRERARRWVTAAGFDRWVEVN